MNVINTEFMACMYVYIMGYVRKFSDKVIAHIIFTKYFVNHETCQEYPT